MNLRYIIIFSIVALNSIIISLIADSIKRMKGR